MHRQQQNPRNEVFLIQVSCGWSGHTSYYGSFEITESDKTKKFMPHVEHLSLQCVIRNEYY